MKVELRRYTWMRKRQPLSLQVGNAISHGYTRLLTLKLIGEWHLRFYYGGK